MNTRGKLVGEFILIVVGVTVALMLETYMSERNDGDLRDEYLSRIRSDIAADKQAIEYRVDFFTAVQQFSEVTQDWMEADAAVDQSVILAAFYAAETWPFLPNLSTYQDLQNTGNFRLIDDIDLRTSLFLYHNKADLSRSGFNPSHDYRRIIRGVIPRDAQSQIREHCPTADYQDLIPTGFPPCELQDIDLDQITVLFSPLRSDTSFRRILNYRHSELSVMIRLLRQQLVFAEEVLVHLEN